MLDTSEEDYNWLKRKGVKKDRLSEKARARIQRKLRLDDPWYRLILKMTKSINFNQRNVLEIGCGLGGFCIHAAKRGANAIGLDINSSAVKKAKELAQKSKFRNQLDFVIGDAQFLPFRNASNDIVVCSETLEHIPNYKRAFNQLVRVTGESGYLCVTVPNMLSPSFLHYVMDARAFHMFHYFNFKKQFSRKDLEVIEFQGTDFIHIPFINLRIKKAVKKESRLQRFLKYLERYGQALKALGANMGIIARKKNYKRARGMIDAENIREFSNNKEFTNSATYLQKFPVNLTGCTRVILICHLKP